MVFAEEMRRLCGILNSIIAEALPWVKWGEAGYKFCSRVCP